MAKSFPRAAAATAVPTATIRDKRTTKIAGKRIFTIIIIITPTTTTDNKQQQQHGRVSHFAMSVLPSPRAKASAVLLCLLSTTSVRADTSAPSPRQKDTSSAVPVDTRPKNSSREHSVLRSSSSPSYTEAQ